MITIHDEMIQGSEEWFLARCGSMGSSSVAQAMAGGAGKSRKTLAYNLIAETITGEKTSFKTTAAMEEGVAREAESREYFTFVTGLDITEVRRQHPTLGMIGGINKFALAHGRDAIDKELVVPASTLRSYRMGITIDQT